MAITKYTCVKTRSLLWRSKATVAAIYFGKQVVASKRFTRKSDNELKRSELYTEEFEGFGFSGPSIIRVGTESMQITMQRARPASPAYEFKRGEKQNW